MLWDDETYPKWAAAFSGGSKAEGTWEEGSTILFLDDKRNGMLSEIVKNIPCSIMSFRHTGEVKNGEVQPLNEKSKEWVGGTETYKLEENNGFTTLTVELDTIAEFATFFKETFPKAIAIVKELCEKPMMVNVTAEVEASLDKVWDYWTAPQHIMQWNTASPDWHTVKAVNDLTVGGKFSSRMEAKDGSFGFDFGGTYVSVKPKQQLIYSLEDERKVEIKFTETDGTCQIIETFEAETQNSITLQKMGWQAILDSFKSYVERN